MEQALAQARGKTRRFGFIQDPRRMKHCDPQLTGKVVEDYPKARRRGYRRDVREIFHGRAEKTGQFGMDRAGIAIKQGTNLTPQPVLEHGHINGKREETKELREGPA